VILLWLCKLKLLHRRWGEGHRGCRRGSNVILLWLRKLKLLHPGCRRGSNGILLRLRKLRLLHRRWGEWHRGCRRGSTRRPCGWNEGIQRDWHRGRGIF
jgi:hypothetical protein